MRWSLLLATLRAPALRPRAAPDGSLTDRFLPALLFGMLGVSSASGAVAKARLHLVDPSFRVSPAEVLDLTYPVLTFLFCTLVATLFLIRRAPRGSRAGPPALAVAIAGTFMMGAVGAQPRTTQDWRVLVLADSLLAGGLTFSIYAAASLGRSFGLAPEARGLVTSGAYRLVRHPLYLGELVAALGVLLPILWPLTISIFSCFCLCQGVRAVLEERALTAAFPEYAEYRRRTPALSPWPRPKPQPDMEGRS
jgi:protein-S-isoprenylcysteine O-methyltransferase Ste14